jgi:hypothetical protein
MPKLDWVVRPVTREAGAPYLLSAFAKVIVIRALFAFAFTVNVPGGPEVPAKSNNEMRRNEQNARCASHSPATRGGGDGGRSHVQIAIMRNVPEKSWPINLRRVEWREWRKNREPRPANHHGGTFGLQRCCETTSMSALWRRTMNKTFACAIAAISLLAVTAPADAKGCIKSPSWVALPAY